MLYAGLLSLIAFLGSPPASRPAPVGQIAFVSGTEQDDQCVCVADLRSGRVTRVGPGRRDNSPVWSADGEWLAFVSEIEDGDGVFLVKADGTAIRRIRYRHSGNSCPCWSADGRRLAYIGDEHVMVYDVAADSEAEWGGGRKGLLRPLWTKDGTLVAIGLVRNAKGMTTDLFRVDTDRTTTLTPSIRLAQGIQATWAAGVKWAAAASPKGPEIAMEMNVGGTRRVFVASPEGDLREVSGHDGPNWNPVWRPDGRAIAFESFRGGRRGICVVSLENGEVSSIAQTSGSDNWAPSWSPDGNWIVFVSNRTGNPEVLVTDEKGQQVRQVTNHPGPDLSPTWRPGGRP
jgi:Tol biopolymer transport system component